MTFDNKLSWKTHVQELKTKTLQQLNILKCTVHIKWGADRDTLIKIYKPNIQTFDSITLGLWFYSVNSSASDKTLSMRNPVLNLGARISIGTFKSSPVVS